MVGHQLLLLPSSPSCVYARPGAQPALRRVLVLPARRARTPRSSARRLRFCCSCGEAMNLPNLQVSAKQCVTVLICVLGNGGC